MVSSLQPIAAFDVDGTVVSGQTQALLVRYLAQRRMLPFSTIVPVAAWFCGYRLGLPMPHTGIRRRVLRSLAGMSFREIDDLAQELFIAQIRSRVRRSAARRIDELNRAGVICILVSASAAPLVRRIASYVGVSHVIATELDTADGIMTGRISGPVVEGIQKVTALSGWADRSFTRWELVEAYGDHVSDAHLLSAARVGYAVNPSARFRRIAIANGWTCIDWTAEGCQD
jgi:HAD superfamily hydrolase (TIGR01490 family)